MKRARREILRERGVDLDWSSYRDCPFVNKKLVESYKSVSSKGYYHRFYSIMVSVASIALKNGYDIAPHEIEAIMREIDADTGSWYTKRPIRAEAENAIRFARESA